MAFANLTWTIGFIPCLFLSLANTELTGEARLLDVIFKEYKREARPCRNASKPVQVAVGFILTRLDELELRDQILSTTGWLSITWKDEFLTWNPHLYDNLTKVNAMANAIWLPEIALDNSVENIFDDKFTDRFRVSIHYSGEVLWEPGGTFHTACEMSINAYPFDHQTCNIVFANWQYTKDQVNLTSSQSKINMETFAENGEWEIEYTKLVRAEWSSENRPSDVYPEIVVTIHVRRRVLYYLVHIMMPCVMMSLLVLVVFHLPPDSGEKVSLGVTVLLAFSVFQLMIAESVPTSSKSIPLIGIYLLFFMGESTVSVAVSVLVLNLHHRMEYKPPPDWLRKLVLEWLARVVFMRRIKTNATSPANEFQYCNANAVPNKKDNAVSDKSLLNYESETGYPVSESKGPKQYLDSNLRLPTSPLLPTIGEPDDNTCCSHLENSENSPHRIPDIQIHLSESKSQSVHSEHNDVKTQDKHYLKTCDSMRFEPGVGDHFSLHGLSPEVARSAVRLIKSIAAMDRVPSGCYRDELMTIIRDTYKELRQQRKDDEMDAVFENEWKRMSKIVDRFFFMITLVVMIASTIVVFCIMPYSNHD